MTAIISFDRVRARLTPVNSLLLLIDAQVGRLWESEFARLRTCLTGLARTAAARRVPTIVTTSASHEWGPTISGIGGHADPPIERRVVNPWHEPRIRAAVEAAGRATLIIAGGALEFSLAPCALSAVDAGYDVYAAIDVSIAADPRRVVRMFRAGVKVVDPALVLAELAGDGIATGRSSNRVRTLISGTDG